MRGRSEKTGRDIAGVYGIEVVAQRLLELDEVDLTVRLGALSQYVEANPDAVSLDSFETVSVPRGAFDDLLKAGTAVFGPASARAYSLFYSPVEGVLIKDPELAKELGNLMEQKTAEAAAKATAIISPVLTESLELPQSLAVVVGALLAKSGFVNYCKGVASPPSNRYILQCC